MSTYLELSQALARESGTVSGTNPTAVSGQVGRLLKIVEWIVEADVAIQNLHTGWLWKQKTFSGTTTASSAKYAPTSFSITDLREWLRDDLETGYQPHTIYLTATGVSDERPLREITWQQWRSTYGRGSQTNNYPTVYAISPAREFCLGAIPDATYTVQGEYAQNAVRMTADGDTPGMPEEFHDVIVWRALMMLAEFDEARDQRTTAVLKYNELLEDLQHSQLPQAYLGVEPIA